jgi:hypothetical protein
MPSSTNRHNACLELVSGDTIYFGVPTADVVRNIVEVSREEQNHGKRSISWSRSIKPRPQSFGGMSLDLFWGS